MYDIIIVGGGPAGMTAAMYAARFELKAVIIAHEIGGYMTEAPQIDNFPAFTSIKGIDLTNMMKKQVEELGIEIVEEEVVEINKGFSVKTKSNKEIKGKNIILALGTKRRKLGIKGEDEFAGKGVSYCATCDSPLFRNKIVAVAGGGNSAIVSALLLAKYASEVHIIYRGDSLKADPYWLEKIKEFKNIKVQCCLNIKEIKGSKRVESILLDNGKEMKVEGIFIEIGSVPSTSLIKNLGVELDKEGYIIVDKTQKTNVDGVYAAGDISTGSNKMRQVVTACAEGAIASESIYKLSLEK